MWWLKRNEECKYRIGEVKRKKNLPTFNKIMEMNAHVKLSKVANIILPSVELSFISQ